MSLHIVFFFRGKTLILVVLQPLKKSAQEIVSKRFVQIQSLLRAIFCLSQVRFNPLDGRFATSNLSITKLNNIHFLVIVVVEVVNL